MRIKDELRLVRRDAEQRWRTPWSRARWVFYGAMVGTVAIGLSNVNRPTFRFLTREDGPVEWPQFVIFMAAAVLAALVARGFAMAHRWRPALIYGFMAPACFFVGGEEISWGQRVLGIDTPDKLADLNKQGELTLHNVGNTLAVFNIAMFLISVAGIVIPLVHLRRPWPLNIFQWLISPAYLIAPFAVMVAYRIVRFTVATESRFVVVKSGEWAELCFAVALALFALEQWRHGKRTGWADHDAVLEPSEG